MQFNKEKQTNKNKQNKNWPQHIFLENKRKILNAIYIEKEKIDVSLP
jgi:hypothetical protein